MKNKIYIFPSLIVSMIVIVIALLFLFWETQENKFYIIELAFPFLVFIALLYLIAFNVLGSAQIALDSPSLVKIFYSAILWVGVLTLVVFLLFVTSLKPPEGHPGSYPGAFEVLRGLLTNVAAPLWLAYMSGGLAQYLFMRAFARR